MGYFSNRPQVPDVKFCIILFFRLRGPVNDRRDVELWKIKVTPDSSPFPTTTTLGTRYKDKIGVHEKLSRGGNAWVNLY